jgi:hypothetical protein
MGSIGFIRAMFSSVSDSIVGNKVAEINLNESGSLSVQTKNLIPGPGLNQL